MLLALAQPDRAEMPPPHGAGRGDASRSLGSAPVDLARMGLGPGRALRINRHSVMGGEPTGARAEVLGEQVLLAQGNVVPVILGQPSSVAAGNVRHWRAGTHPEDRAWVVQQAH